MDDIRVANSMPGNHKVLKLEKRVGADGCWALVKLWCWAAENRLDGNLAGLSDEDLELACGWKGAVPLIPVLAELQLLDGQPGAYQIHDWHGRQPYVVGRAQRQEQARQNALQRWKNTTPEQRTEAARTAAQSRWGNKPDPDTRTERNLENFGVKKPGKPDPNTRTERNLRAAGLTGTHTRTHLDATEPLASDAKKS
jgi:hypothetical protein